MLRESNLVIGASYEFMIKRASVLIIRAFLQEAPDLQPYQVSFSAPAPCQSLASGRYYDQPMALSFDTPEDRARQADKIVKNPSNYKICEGCDSIVLAKTSTCPNCASYRFQEGPASVIAQARLLGKRERRSVMASDFE